jgi:hypothetical protein
VLAASWLRCPDLLRPLLGTTRAARDERRPDALGPPARPTDLKVSTAATALSNMFGFIQMPPASVKRPQRLLRGVRDEAVMSMD